MFDTPGEPQVMGVPAGDWGVFYGGHGFHPGNRIQVRSSPFRARVRQLNLAVSIQLVSHGKTLCKPSGVPLTVYRIQEENRLILGPPSSLGKEKQAR